MQKFVKPYDFLLIPTIILNDNCSTRFRVPAVLAYHGAYKSQHETILADLDWYMTAMRLVIILMDGAIKHTCV